MSNSHHNLETIEASRFCDLNLVRETLQQVFIDNTVGGGEESQDVGDEVLLVLVHAVVPVVQILGQIHLFGSPETKCRKMEETEVSLGVSRKRGKV